MTPENLSRAFKGLEPYGVKVEQNRIIMTDLEELTSYGKPNPLIDDYSA